MNTERNIDLLEHLDYLLSLIHANSHNNHIDRPLVMDEIEEQKKKILERMIPHESIKLKIQ